MRSDPAAGAAWIGRLDTGSALEAASVAYEAFSRSAFHRHLFPYGAERLRRYWETSFELFVSDERAHVYGLRQDGRLVAVLVTTLPGFPRASAAWIYATRLVRRIGALNFLRYLRLLVEWERGLHRDPVPIRPLISAPWLAVLPSEQGRGHGSRLCQWAAQAELEIGGTVRSLADARDARLLSLYRSLGYRVGRPFPYLGWEAVVLDVVRPHPSPEQEHAACTT